MTEPRGELPGLCRVTGHIALLPGWIGSVQQGGDNRKRASSHVHPDDSLPCPPGADSLILSARAPIAWPVPSPCCGALHAAATAGIASGRRGRRAELMTPAGFSRPGAYEVTGHTTCRPHRTNTAPCLPRP